MSVVVGVKKKIVNGMGCIFFWAFLVFLGCWKDKDEVSFLLQCRYFEEKKRYLLSAVSI